MKSNEKGIQNTSNEGVMCLVDDNIHKEQKVTFSFSFENKKTILYAQSVKD